MTHANHFCTANTSIVTRYNDFVVTAVPHKGENLVKPFESLLKQGLMSMWAAKK